VAAYVVVDVVVKDPVRYDDYRKRVMATLEPYNGRFLVRGGKVEALEGTWKPQRFVILEFPDAAAARVVEQRGVRRAESNPAERFAHGNDTRGRDLRQRGWLFTQ
jgi:uncharacterized protein (DUF1330 family)